VRTPLNIVCLGMEALQIEANLTREYVSKSFSIPTEDKCFISSKLDSILNFAGEIVDNGNAAVTVLNDLINYDKIESKSMSIQQSLLDPFQLIEKTLSSLQVQAKQAEITLNLQIDVSRDISTSKLVAFADRVKIGQVIRNVVSNAIKFSPKASCIKIAGINIASESC
jgi:signal transduction histidine kinase